MRCRPLALLAFAGCVFAGTGARASTAPCPPVEAVSDVAALPAGYREALRKLVESTSQPGKPWSCAGGTIAVTISADGRAASVAIVDATGRSVTREVESPEDLRAVAQALLAAPLPPPAPVLPITPSPVSRSYSPPSPSPSLNVGPAPAPPRPAEPRLLLSTTAGPRYSGPSSTLWGAGELRGTIPFDEYRVGLWARFALPLAMQASHPERFSMQEANIGASFGRLLTRGALELTARFEPSLAVVTMEAGLERSGPESEGARLAMRLGLGLSAGLRLSKTFRALGVLDGGFTPTAVGNNPKIAPALPDVPVYTFGVSLGAEAAIP